MIYNIVLVSGVHQSESDMCVCTCSIMSHSATPWTVAKETPLSMDFPKQEYWSGFPFPTRGDLPNPGIKPVSPLVSPALADGIKFYIYICATAKSLQLCLTLCDPVDGSPPGSPVPGVLQARTLRWVAISFFNT